MSNLYIMYTLIGISFTLKGQDFQQINVALLKIKEEIAGRNEKAILVNGFMPKHVVLEKGFSTEVTNTLAELFPLQINCYTDNQPQRKEMASILSEFGGCVYVIGEVVEGVKIEIDEYKAQNVDVYLMDLNGNFLPGDNE